jgi:hypothetical protein
MLPKLSVAMLSVVALGAIAPAARAQTPAPALELIGDSGHTRTLTTDELAALPQAEVRLVGSDSSQVVLRGPTIRSLMTLVGAPEGHALRGENMMLVVVAEASDNYRVVYALAELDEQFGGRTAIVAISNNGNPLPADEGPFRVAMAGEEHRARWIRQLVRLRLVRVHP